MDKWVVDRREASRLLSISLRHLDEMVRQRAIPSFKMGNRRLFDRRKLLEWIDQRHREGV